MEFDRKVAEKRRLAILIFLEQEPDLRMGLNLLHLALETCFIKKMNTDEVTADTDFLRKAGLITLEHIGSLPALRLTLAGREVALGSRKVVGIQRPPLN